MQYQADTRPVPGSNVTLHLLDESGVLFNAGTQQLYNLNTTATFIWCCLEEGLDRCEILRALVQTFGFDSQTAETHAAEIIREWRQLGLLSPSTPGTDARDGPDAGAPGTALDLSLLDVAFRVRISPPRLLDDLMPLVGSLVTAARPGFHLLEIAADGAGLAIRGPGGSIDRCRGRDELAPLVKICLTRIALEHSHDFCAVHAAGVDLDGRCLLLPGASGSGKSTLAAALCLSGLGLLGDDTIVLERDTLDARAMPFAVCLKPGAWHLLGGRAPNLMHQAVFNRPDGKHVRYLSPAGPARLPSTARRAVGWIVFPHVEPGRPPELVPLPRAEALSRLLQGCYPLGTGLDPARVARLVGWISEIPCFELRYSSLDAAVEQLRGLSP